MPKQSVFKEIMQSPTMPFLFFKNNIKNMERQVRGCGKIFANYVFDARFMAKIYERNSHLPNNKDTQTKTLARTHHEGRVGKADKHRTRTHAWSSGKGKLEPCSHPGERLKLKRQTKPKAGEAWNSRPSQTAAAQTLRRKRLCLERQRGSTEDPEHGPTALGNKK